MSITASWKSYREAIPLHDSLHPTNSSGLSLQNSKPVQVISVPTKFHILLQIPHFNIKPPPASNMYFATTTAIITAALAVTASAAPSMEKRYAKGWCGVHVQQFQKNEGNGDTSNYRLSVELYDANKAPLNGTNATPVPDGASLDLDSPLPAVFITRVGYLDDDALSFAYNGQEFNSGSPQCIFGGYGGGSRQGDCGFTCA